MLKKLITIILILAVVLMIPSAVLADKTDPIVGAWYMYYTKADVPEMESAFPGVDQAIAIYIFFEDGVIYVTGTQITGKTGVPEYTSCGKWEKADYQYNVGIMGLGEGSALIEDDNLLIQIQKNYYMKLHKIHPINPYTDFVIR